MMKDMKKRWMLEGEDGSVLIIALIMMVLLTMLGISATTNTEIEIQIANNDMVYKQTLYTAEAGVMEAAQSLENSSDLKNNPPSWLETTIGAVSHGDILDENFWEGQGTTTQTSSFQDTRFVALSEGIATGSSLDMSKSKVYSYRVLGRSTRNNGLFIIEMGYRRAF